MNDEDVPQYHKIIAGKEDEEYYKDVEDVVIKCS
jgi:hypothetical protein